MRVVLTGGGTGGHVLPNVAIIRALRGAGFDGGSKPGGSEIFYIGEHNSFEQRAMKKEDVEFFGIYAGKLRRYFDIQNLIDIFKLPVGFGGALWILRKLRPDLVFAKGGYVSVPVVLAARTLGIPVWLHESDVSPGLANKICMKFAEKIFLSFEESKKFFGAARDTAARDKAAYSTGKAAQKIEVVGNPIRAEILKGDKHKGYKLAGFTDDKPVVLVIGGSTGAASLNRLVYAVLPRLLKHAQVVHITGARASGTQAEERHGYKCFEFLGDELADIYAIADLVVSRAGSSVIFELLALHKPMILLPLPLGSSRGDQIENAAVFEHNGWAKVLNQDLVTPEEFLKSVLEFIKSDIPRVRMSEGQKKADMKGAAEKIAEAIKAY